jgi:hypothetical protein
VKKRKNSQRADVLVSATKRNYIGIVVMAGLSITLVFAAFLTVSTGSSGQTVSTRAIHGELINSPPETNIASTANVSPVKEVSTNALSTNTVAGPKPGMIETNGNYLQIGFDKLASFQLRVVPQVTDPVKLTWVDKLSWPIPHFIKDLDNRKVALTGFMLPIKLENARATEFLLMRSRKMCCFGMPLQANELVYVHMKGKGVKSVMDVPITIYGTLHVGEIRANNRIVGIYQLDGEEKSEPADFR